MKRNNAHIIEAERGPGWQEYQYEDGRRVPEGEPIGIEFLNSRGEWELLLFDGIFFSSESDNYEEIK